MRQSQINNEYRVLKRKSAFLDQSLNWMSLGELIILESSHINIEIESLFGYCHEV